MQNLNDNREDLRIQRTRTLLLKALFELTIEKGFGAVTVRDITNRARVNRSTFYRHYLDKHELLNQYLDELQTQVTEAAQKAAMTSASMPFGLLLLLQNIQENAAFFRVMLGEQGDPGFVHRVRQFSENRYRYLFSQTPENPAQPLTNLRLSYIAAATVGTILWWLENNQPISAEQLAVWLGQLNMSSAGLT